MNRVDLVTHLFAQATIQWPDYTMDDLTVAPYFSAYFFDEGGVLPARPEELFRNISRGEGAKLNSADFIIGTTRLVRSFCITPAFDGRSF